MVNKIFSTSAIFLIIFFISASSILNSVEYRQPVFLIIMFTALYFGTPETNKKFIQTSIVTLSTWIGISILSNLFTSAPFDLNAIILFGSGLIFAISIVHLFKWHFWIKFEKYVFFLTFLSLPIFTLNVFFPQFFDSLWGVFRPLTNERFFRFDEFRNYWSAIVYVKAMQADFLYRNSGFMWEPGAFAMMIIWALSFHWLRNGAKFERKSIVYTIALITTQSTAGYLAYGVLYSAIFFKRFNAKNVIILTLFAFIFYNYVFNLDFVSGKLDSYIYMTEHNILSYDESFEAYKVNRIQIVSHELHRVFNYPLGYGISFRDEIISVNGLVALLVIWGIPLFIFFLYLIRKFYTLYNLSKLNNRVLFLFFIALLMMFFSNPIQQNLFFYLLIATPVLLNVNKLENAKYKQI